MEVTSMRKRFSYLLLPVITLILEILPYGAVCNFANPEGESWRRTFSYFDMTPFGYANFAPLLTAMVTCLILAFLAVYLFTNKHRMFMVVRSLLWIGVVLSLCPLLYGIRFFSLVGAMITVSLVAELILVYIAGK